MHEKDIKQETIIKVAEISTQKNQETTEQR